MIERNARAQAQIIEDLLDMSRIISGKVLLDVQRVDLVPIIRVAIDSVTPMATAKGIRVRSALDPNAQSVSADPARIQQVLGNLLTNALKFTPRDGSVTVESERVHSGIQIRVADTGQGITSNFLPHVFDRFRQADASSTRRHGGLGLGLAIVKNLVELHGGTVRAESAGQNRGCTFTVSLPIAPLNLASESQRTPPRTSTPSEATRPKANLTGLRILVVDDELDARELLKRILSGCGALVETAASAEEALAAFGASAPDVLITDIGMPDADGYAVLQKVRALSTEDGGAVPAIALTAFARAEDRERALQSGFQVHLAKPLDSGELLESVAKLAGRADS